ncbi:hypothetical protein BU23DRAFT_63213 [Bimuria novae-zelandiae CBS 107.79]|uniref:Mid2 domain-containing protein n=1 Tax=Bimuria novae-zelandiae CBS 107.79 TaxID=1447943 RepID=A0A6A5UKS0_9PLEO|nr:hypothetical protein BU23DRAFT_63213 [Bimuria novae-zelandiae CBS 107.79]
MATNGTAAPTTEPSSTPVSLPTSNPSTDAPSTSEPPASPTPEQSSTPPPPTSTPPPPSSAAPSNTPRPSTTSTVIADTTTPTKTEVITSIVTPSVTGLDETPAPVTVVSTIIRSGAPDATSSAPTPSSTPTNGSDPQLANPSNKQASGGLSAGGKTAIAVVIPVVVVALLLLAGIWFWRKRKSRKNAEEARRKEVEEYGFNPNEDPTLPAVGMQSEMAEDQSGYRGWGNTTTSSGHKASTTLTSGMTYSDSNSNPGDVNYINPSSPTHAYSDAHSGDPLVNGRRETLDSDGIGALGAAPAANQNQAGVQRGPSNASSSYSAADRSDHSGDYPIPINNPQEYYDNNGYYQNGPYDNGYGANQQPIIRDVSARRNTRIENPSVFPQQGNSGIAQNF